MLEERNRQMEMLLAQVKADRTRALKELAAMQQDGRLAMTAQVGQDAAYAQIQSERSELESQCKALKDQLDRISALHERTLSEKHFVEDAFLKLDDHLTAAAMASSVENTAQAAGLMPEPLPQVLPIDVPITQGAQQSPPLVTRIT